MAKLNGVLFGAYGSAVTKVDTFLSNDEVEELDEIWHRFGSRTSERQIAPGARDALVAFFRPGLAPRADAVANFVKTGGRFGIHEPQPLLVARGRYFRDIYAMGGEVDAPGIEVLLHHDRLAQLARDLSGCAVAEPEIVYSNVLLPGQELGLHTDVPMFRGADRSNFPLWFLVAMRHSGLFEPWRIPIVTAVLYLDESQGGEFAFYPDATTAVAEVIKPGPGMAVIFDADTIFHGIDRVVGDTQALRALGERPHLIHEESRNWSLITSSLKSPPARIGRFTSEELRFSVSWKARCFKDDDDCALFESHKDDLDARAIFDALMTELYERGRLKRYDHALTDTQLARLMIDEFIRFPGPERQL